MPWSGGNYTKGNNGTGGWAGDAAAGIGIEAGRHDTQDNDFATGINQCLNKDGSNAATGNLNIGGFKVSNMATGTASGDATTLGQIQAGVNTQSTTLAVTNTRFSADSTGPVFSLQKSRGASVGTNTIVQNGDTIGVFNFLGANGSSFTAGASITAIVDGTPGATNDMPVRLSIGTTPDGTGVPVERMSIGSAGQIIVRSDVSNTDGTGLDQGQLYIHDIDTSGSGLLLGYRYQAAVTEYARIQVRNGNALAIQAGGGNVGIGLNNPTYRLQLSQDSAAKPTTNTWTIASDARIKTNVKPYAKGLTDICKIKPIEYDYNGKGGLPAGPGGISIIAQELQSIFPECIGSYKAKLNEDDEQETDILNYNGHAITFALINAVKELNAKIELLEARVAALEA